MLAPLPRSVVGNLRLNNPSVPRISPGTGATANKRKALVARLPPMRTTVEIKETVANGSTGWLHMCATGIDTPDYGFGYKHLHKFPDYSRFLLSPSPFLPFFCVLNKMDKYGNADIKFHCWAEMVRIDMPTRKN
jgi:hypothetical protein